MWKNTAFVLAAVVVVMAVLLFKAHEDLRLAERSHRMTKIGYDSCTDALDSEHAFLMEIANLERACQLRLAAALNSISYVPDYTHRPMKVEIVEPNPNSLEAYKKKLRGE